MTSPEPCPVCQRPVKGKWPYSSPRRDATGYDCVHCGRFGLTRPAERRLAGSPDEFPARRRAILSHAIRRAQVGQDEPPLLGSDVVERIISDDFLPTPQEQADNLLLWVGGHLPGPGEHVVLSFDEHGAIVGSQSIDGFRFILNGLAEAKQINWDQNLVGRETAKVTLTFPGWSRYEELRRGAPSGRRAFMAMKYNDELLDRIVDDHFRPAVAQTGFDLRRFIDEPKAGQIDAQMRVDIRASPLPDRRPDPREPGGVLGSRVRRRARQAGDLHVPGVVLRRQPLRHQPSPPRALGA